MNNLKSRVNIFGKQNIDDNLSKNHVSDAVRLALHRGMLEPLHERVRLCCGPVTELCLMLSTVRSAGASMTVV